LNAGHCSTVLPGNVFGRTRGINIAVVKADMERAVIVDRLNDAVVELPFVTEALPLSTNLLAHTDVCHREAELPHWHASTKALC
jgi:hypothetical protein